MESSKIAICCGCTRGSWYAQGIKRLIRSLIHEGYGGEIVSIIDADPAEIGSPYNIKIKVIRKALDQGFKHILWLDASVWVVRDVMPVFDFINVHGFYAFQTGYKLSNTANDRLLDYVGMSRDFVDSFPEHASGIVGLNYDHADGKFILDEWIRLCDAGMFEGSRFHDNQSQDSRFKFFRQDQSALSVVLCKLGKINNEHLDWVTYDEQPHNPDTVIFKIRGM